MHNVYVELTRTYLIPLKYSDMDKVWILNTRLPILSIPFILYINPFGRTDNIRTVFTPDRMFLQNLIVLLGCFSLMYFFSF
jgi:hypothetical protein